MPQACRLRDGGSARCVVAAVIGCSPRGPAARAGARARGGACGQSGWPPAELADDATIAQAVVLPWSPEAPARAGSPCVRGHGRVADVAKGAGELCVPWQGGVDRMRLGPRLPAATERQRDSQIGLGRIIPTLLPQQHSLTDHLDRRVALELHDIGEGVVRDAPRIASSANVGKRGVEHDGDAAAQEQPRAIHQRRIRPAGELSRIEALVEGIALRAWRVTDRAEIAAEGIAAQVHATHGLRESRRQRRLAGPRCAPMTTTNGRAASRCRTHSARCNRAEATAPSSPCATRRQVTLERTMARCAT